LVEELIQEGTDCVLYADKQSLKSFIALDIGLSVATGTKALESFAVKRPGIVFYFAGEGRDNMERKRATAWEISHGFAPFSVENVYIGSGAVRRVHIVLNPLPMTLTKLCVWSGISSGSGAFRPSVART
jgi:RecA-family ATPase